MIEFNQASATQLNLWTPQTARQPEWQMLNAVELFAGAGGLGLGISLAGFKPKAVVEWDRWAVDTLRENRDRGFPLLADCPIVHADVRKVDFESIVGPVDLVSGGPPCQPFSMGGKHRAFADDRDMFPAAVDVVRRLRPRAFIIENVKGITRSSFSNYLQYIELQFRCPEVVKKADEIWQDHFIRLQREHTAGGDALRYNLVRTLVNAADYGIPQRRERVFLVGFRADLGIEWNFPEPTHSLDALLVDQWVTGDYWDRQAVKRQSLEGTAYWADPVRLESLRRRNDRSDLRQPWRTVRDALQGMPEPTSKGHGNWHNHKLQSGAKSYKGHTGSPLDLPAKALKAGDHGVPGGENMMVRDDGSVRYFSVRESARLQTFPDSFVFHGAWSETMRQLGNAVPVALAHLVASEVAQCLLRTDYQNLVHADLAASQPN
jgi:DNA (cytosine-5)-methyltransferase 1